MSDEKKTLQVKIPTDVLAYRIIKSRLSQLLGEIKKLKTEQGQAALIGTKIKEYEETLYTLDGLLGAGSAFLFEVALDMELFCNSVSERDDCREDFTKPDLRETLSAMADGAMSGAKLYATYRQILDWMGSFNPDLNQSLDNLSSLEAAFSVSAPDDKSRDIQIRQLVSKAQAWCEESQDDE